MNRSAIALAALLAMTVGASAADLGWNNTGSSPIYSSTPVSGWDGFYAGVNGGYAWGETTVSPAPGALSENDATGWNLGAQAGYNMDMGGFVLGGEADLQWANVGYSETIAAGTFEAKTDFYGTIRSRAGVPIGQVMPYATLGVAFGHGTASVTAPGGVTTSQGAGHFGWTAGLGLEAKATENLSFKAEYLYVDLGAQNYSGVPVGTNSNITQRFSTIRAGVNYAF